VSSGPGRALRRVLVPRWRERRAVVPRTWEGSRETPSVSAASASVSGGAAAAAATVVVVVLVVVVVASWARIAVMAASFNK